jgi:hypothetical protein
VRSIFRAMLAALRAIRWIAVRTIRIGGKLVTLLAQTSPVEQPVSSDIGFEDVQPPGWGPENRFARIRELARELVRNPDTPPADMVRGIDPTAAVWLAAMPNEMLVRVSLASDAALADHIAGRRCIRGVLSYDRESVREYERAMATPELTHTFDTELMNSATM